MDFTELSYIGFCDELSSKAPVPGGGGASALIGALGMAMGNMVAYLTLGKKKYADVEEEIAEILKKGEAIRKQLQDCVTRDAEVFKPLSECYSLPNDTEDEKKYRSEKMETCLKNAASVPLEIMRLSAESLELLKILAEKGSRLAVSDAANGAVASRAALQGGALNLYINTKSMLDREYAKKLNDEADDLLRKYLPLADEIYEMVSGGLK